jgi:hypothetical protein
MTTLSVYPSSPKPSYALLLDHEFKTIISEFESGIETRDIRRRFPKRVFSLAYNSLDLTDAQRNALTDFFDARNGRKEPFWFFDPARRYWKDVYMGRWDGATLTYNIPGRSTEGTKAYSYLIDDSGNYIVDESGNKIIVGMNNENYPNIYINGEDAFDWGFSSGTGVGEAGLKCDQATWGAVNAHNIGDLITASFWGYLMVKVRFQDDKLTEEVFSNDLSKIQWSLYEVRN